jgi:4-hydroxy-2-oxoheptanedioate aldolase
MASCGFDWLCIDLQHGFATPGDLLPMLQAAAITQTVTLVRVPRMDTGLIGRALDAGAAGVIVPMVNSAAQASEAVRACRYAPDGDRSWGPARLMLAEPGYSAREANARVRCLVMVETLEAVRNLPEIIAVQGVDAVFVGPSDLAVDMGLAPQRGPIPGDHAATLAGIARTCQQAGMPAGIFGGTAAAVADFEEMGFTILTAFTDAAVLRAGALQGLRDIRAGTVAPSP